MAKVPFLSVLLSVFLSFHMALGDSGWVIAHHGLDHICRLTQDYASVDMCKPLSRTSFRILPEYYSARITDCSVISLKFALKPKIGLHLFVDTQLTVSLGPLLQLHVNAVSRLILQIGRYGLYVHGCAVLDVEVKGRSSLTTDALTQVTSEALVRSMAGPMCERGRAWCRELNYCLDFDQYPYPITPSCYGIWRNQPPRIIETQIELRSQPVCSCKEMEEGISVSIDSLVALQTTISARDQSVYFCHEKDATYIFECMRRGGSFNDLYVSVSLTVGAIAERFPKAVFFCPNTANIVIKIECTRIYVDMQPGHALLCFRSRIRIGCDMLNFTSSMTFTVSTCMNLFFDVDCRREALLLSVSPRSPLRIRSRCPEGEECETDEGSLIELFRTPLTAWCMSHINAKIRNGLRIPFLRYYPCDRCEKPIYVQRRVYCPCTLSYVPK